MRLDNFPYFFNASNVDPILVFLTSELHVGVFPFSSSYQFVFKWNKKQFILANILTFAKNVSLFLCFLNSS